MLMTVPAAVDVPKVPTEVAAGASVIGREAISTVSHEEMAAAQIARSKRADTPDSWRIPPLTVSMSATLLIGYTKQKTTYCGTPEMPHFVVL
jgi:hypothetical protein